MTAVLLVGLLVGCQDDTTGPAGSPSAGDPGLLSVHTVATGTWLPDGGVQVLIDDDPATVRRLGLNASLEVLLPPGEHSVELFRGGGLTFYPACSIDGELRREVMIEPGGSTGIEFEMFCEVALRLTASTTGSPVDPDGYRLLVGPSQIIDPDLAGSFFPVYELAVEDELDFDRGSPVWWSESGDPQTWVYLWDEAPNCTLLGPNPVPLNPGGRELHYPLSVECVEPPPVSGTIYFTGGAGDLFSVNADGSGMTQLSHGWSMDEWTLSPDGTEVIFSQGEGYFGRGSSDGTVLEYVTADGFDGEELQWGADDRLYFTQFSEAGQSEVYSMRLDGTDRRQISQNVGYHPALSPDGSTLIYESATGLTLSDPDGSNPRDVPLDIHLIGLRWSPDGSLVAGRAQGTSGFRPLELVVFDPFTGDSTVVLSRPFEFRTFFAWSPDGTQLVYAATQSSPEFPYDRDHPGDLFTVSADGYNLARVTNSGTGYPQLDWRD